MGSNHPGRFFGSGNGLGHWGQSPDAIHCCVHVRRLAVGDGGGARRSVRGFDYPGMGEAIIIEAFVVVVIGGLGSLRGAFLGSLVIGLLNSFGTRFIPMLDMFLIFILMAVVLLWRPQGFFAEGKHMNPILDISLIGTLLGRPSRNRLIFRPIHSLYRNASHDSRNFRAGVQSAAGQDRPAVFRPRGLLCRWGLRTRSFIDPYSPPSAPGDTCRSIAAASVLALIIGFFCVRHTEIYFAMLTLAFGMMVFSLMWNLRSVTGGDDGLYGITRSSISLGFFSFPLGRNFNTILSCFSSFC